jgi:superfamily II DNA/RNA helicase
MNIFEVHEGIISDYKTYIESFVNIKNEAIKKKIDEDIDSGNLWPDPLIQFNPSYKPGRTVKDLIIDGILHSEIDEIFTGYKLYEHQVKAITLGSRQKDFVVTSGTGSGKSLTFLGTIFNHLLQNKSEKGIKAVIIYPMNALINSQFEEISKFKDPYEKKTGKPFPFTFAQYTGQEKEDERKEVRDNPPDILLTNYMMLELILTRLAEKDMRDSIYQSLKYLVFDELHTYRGRQGSDVAMLIRRIKAKCKNEISCIGTSATMVSGDNPSDQKAEVAKVATTFFGSTFQPDQIVIESLTQSLKVTDDHLLRSLVINEIKNGIYIKSDHDILINSPLAQWLENHIALQKLGDGTFAREKPLTFEQITELLQEFSGLSPEDCRKSVGDLLQWIAFVNMQTKGNTHNAILPFKLHQFISQTGSVYMTLDKDNNDKTITLEAGVYVSKEKKEKKPIFPVVFSRESGHEFICVTKNNENKKLEPREFSDRSIAEDDSDSEELSGYIFYGDNVWDDDRIPNLPDAFLNTKREKVNKKYRHRIPSKIWFNEMGHYSETEPLVDDEWQQGWFMPYKLLFDPTSDTYYDTRTSENTKLTKLGSEGRSTSTTVLSFVILQKLADAGYDAAKQKVLSFTDNRQDAALQSGHFNDFIQTLHVRTGIFSALLHSSNGYLGFDEIGGAIFDALNLPQEDYAHSAANFPGPKKENEKALKDFLTYKLLYDLRGSWRVIMPNLEQCGLLKISYKYLDETIIDPAFVNGMDILSDFDIKERKDFIQTTLDYFRKAFAIRSTEFLEGNQIEVKKRNIIQKLKTPWTFGNEEKVPEPNSLRFENVPAGYRKFTQSIGFSSAYGRYFRFLYLSKRNERLNKETYNQLIENFLDLLGQASWLYSEEVALAGGEKTKIYQLNIDMVLWNKADEKFITADPIKTRSYQTTLKPANRFFKSIYRIDFHQLKKLEAKDHTGQISKAEDRQEREKLFREGKLSALYCSPTMELGIDISTLDIVHMRNVPPNPANYAQRSGRAGRSGQAALVFTYCGAYSPHDRNYFKNAIEMVSGNVVAPKLDLANKELLKTHLYALYLSELGLQEINRSIADIIDEDFPVELPIRDSLRIKILNGSTIQLKKNIEISFKKAVRDFLPLLEKENVSWYTDNWIAHTISSFYNEFDKSLNRWRTLYQAAKVQLDEATSVIKSGLWKVNSPEYKEADQNQRQATRQLTLLRNDERNSLTEFYPFRYFASEGFLPGYNFTRLPIRTYLQSAEAGEFLSRPRFIALREFGPKNIIYHNGSKFSIDQLVLKEKLTPVKAKVSLKSGYFLDGADADADTCPITHTPLDSDSNRKNFIDLVEITETRGVQRDRINCDEEERASQGFDIKTYFSVPAGIHTLTKAKITVDGEPLLNLNYIPSARLVQVNSKWRKTNREGFKIGMNSGFWRSHSFEPASETSEETKTIQLFTQDTADALYIQPVEALGLSHEGIVTLMYALKRAIEIEFQVEPGEIGVSQMGDQENPNIFIYESAEGSLGILSQIVSDIDVFNRLIIQAIKVCRYDDQQYVAPASYEDLLSYYNQRDHKIIDRFLIEDKLDVLKSCKVEVQHNPSQDDYDAHYQMLLRRLDKSSQTELKFIEHLYKNNLRLPDSAQQKHEDIYVMPDFYYEKERTWIFCDGTPHDKADVKERDKKQRETIINKGEFYWVYYYKDNLEEKIAERPDLFKKIR